MKAFVWREEKRLHGATAPSGGRKRQDQGIQLYVKHLIWDLLYLSGKTHKININN